jgi:hypothetical protein
MQFEFKLKSHEKAINLIEMTAQIPSPGLSAFYIPRKMRCNFSLNAGENNENRPDIFFTSHVSKDGFCAGSSSPEASSNTDVKSFFR